MNLRFGIIFVFVLISIVSSTNGFSLKGLWNKHFGDKSPCTSWDCQRLARDVRLKMDMSVHPCDDFYKFACGNYTQRTKIPEGYSEIDSMSEARDRVLLQLKHILEDRIHENELEQYQNVKKLYRSCMNEYLIERRGLAPMKRLMRIFGGWPALEGSRWDEQAFNWKKAISRLRKMGFKVDYFFDYLIERDEKDPQKYSIGIINTEFPRTISELNVLLEFKRPSKLHEFKLNHRMTINERFVSEMLEAVEFEKKILRLSISESSHVSKKDVKIKELEWKLAFIDWFEYFNAPLPYGFKINDTRTINIRNYDFLYRINDLFKSTKKRTIANYIMWRLLEESSVYFAKKSYGYDISSLVYDLGQISQYRWKFCTQLTSENLPIETGALYVHKILNEEAKEAVEDVTNEILDEFKDIIENSYSFNWRTREMARKLLAPVEVIVGYPKELKREISDYQKNLRINEEKFYESIMKIKKINLAKEMKKIVQPYAGIHWTDKMRPVHLFSHYHISKYHIIIPAGILQYPLFSTKLPKFHNYATIGTSIAHEIGHMPLFEEMNTLEKMYYDQVLESEVKCVENKYNNYRESKVNLKIDGHRTLAENIADIVSIKLAHRIYKNYKSDYGPERKLYDFEFSGDQLFWISSAQIWCSAAYESAIEHRINHDVHSTPSFRAIGPISNMKEFAEDFQCPIGSYMNPPEKCTFW